MFDSINWEAPWLAGLRGLAIPILQADDWRAALNAAASAKSLSNRQGLPIRFVPQAELPAGIAYEAHIGATGCVPTRSNLHDFFNALVWLAYPQIKQQLNALQAAEIARLNAMRLDPDTASAPRGKLRDATTIFDENAALFVTADASLAAALRAHQWQELFVARRTAFGAVCRVQLFGHALLEKLVAPYKAITAHAWVLVVEPEFLRLPEREQAAQLDRVVSAQLEIGLTTASFTPLPVLGVPGWCDVQDQDFYADRTVFRPERLLRVTTPLPGPRTRA